MNREEAANLYDCIMADENFVASVIEKDFYVAWQLPKYALLYVQYIGRPHGCLQCRLWDGSPSYKKAKMATVISSDKDEFIRRMRDYKLIDSTERV